jgi:hypothetical protein
MGGEIDFLWVVNSIRYGWYFSRLLLVVFPECYRWCYPRHIIVILAIYYFLSTYIATIPLYLYLASYFIS